MKKITCLGMGAWGYCLASLLAKKNEYEISCWTTNPNLVTHLTYQKSHPRKPSFDE